MPEQKTYSEEFKVSGKDLKDKIKNLINEGNVRRIIIKNESGNTIMEIPVNFALVGTILAPAVAAVGAIAAFITNSTVIVEREKKEAESETKSA